MLPAPVLDHVVLDVHTSMDAAAARARAQGFTLTPMGHHTMGSINHLAMFGTDYLELLGWPEGDPPRPELAGYPPGLNGLVFKTDDADAVFAHLDRVGLAAGPVQAFSRPVTVDGALHHAAFRTVHVDRAQGRIGRLYFCQHLTPGLVWRPEWQAHTNGATGIAEVTIAAHDPAATAGLFRTLFGDDAVRPRGAGFVMAAGAAQLVIGPPAGAADPAGRGDHIAALRLHAPWQPAIPAAEAGNVRLVFGTEFRPV